MKRQHTILFAFVATLTFFPSLLFAQQVNEGNKTGFPPFGSFHGSNFDLVSLQNGNLHIEIPITSVPQRGGRSFTYRFVYDVPSYTMQQFSPDGFTHYWLVNPVPNEAARWRLETPNHWTYNFEIIEQQCSYYQQGLVTVDYWLYRNWTVTDPNGSKHPLQLRYENGPANKALCTDGDVPRGNQLKGVALDGTGILFDATGWPSASPKAHTKDGTRVVGVGGGLDTNGNILVDSADMLNRTLLTSVTYPNHLQPQYTIWTVKNSAGAAQEFRVDYTLISATTNFCGTLPPLYQDDDCFEAGAGGYLPTKLTLPNGKFYQFTWNSTGDLTSVALPTGGTIAYTYGGASYLVNPTSTELEKWVYLARYNARRHVLTRTVSDGQTQQQWTYNGEYGDEGTTMIVRDPLGNEQVHLFAEIGHGKFETEVRMYQGLSTTGTLLRKVTKQYASEQGPILGEGPGDGLMNVRLIRETTTLDDNQVSKVETDYETFQETFLGAAYTATRLNVTQRREYAFGAGTPGALQRKTTYAYLHTGNSNYLNRNIVDRVTTTQIYDGASVLKAQTTNEYDGYSTGGGEGIAAANAVQHDATNYGTGFIYRGNVTAVKRWRNTDGAWLETRHLKYDTTGNVLKTRDPLSHVSNFNYDNSWGNTTCAPAGNARAYLKSATNALGHVATSTYDSCTGSVASATDPNSQTTTFTYDAFDRQDITSLPDGGQVDRDYDDTARIVTSKTKRTASDWLVNRAHYDVLGRVWREELCEDGSPTCAQSVNTYTLFDSLGRVSKVTNPTRCQSSSFPASCAGEATFGITESLYDGLGRVTKVIPPDGTTGTNHVVSSYSGSTNTVTDQAGKKRKSETDALGRLIRVWEPDAGQALVHVTRYQYDTLDNLLCVHQKSTDATADKACTDATVPATWRPRKFTYNSLSQLTQAVNPESGTITYTYDNDGNLLTKTDARGIVATHGYDVLHRLTTKSFSDGTPTQSMVYDVQTDGSWQAYLVGRLSRSCWQGTYADCDYFGYDSMGRATRHEQGGGLWPSTLYAYNLSGGVTALGYYEYYLGRIRWVNYDYDSAGRVRKAYETTGAQTVYADNIQYHAHGAWSSMALSNGAMQQSAAYNSRLQPTIKTVSKVSPASTIMNFTYSFVDGAGLNNGNVQGMNDTVQALNYVFQYDELNRLARAETTNNNLWGNTYVYDIWANLYQKNQIAGKQQGEFFQQTMNSKNQFVAWSYDAAGNLLNDGAHNYQYDPEGRIRCMDAGANCVSAAASYVYSVEGRRVKRAVGGATTLYLHDGGSVLSEFANPSPGVGTWQKDYIYLGGQLLASESATDGTRYHFSDHLGTPRVIADAAGGVVSRHDYYPYGKEITAWSDGESHKFTGKERDTESGLDYFIARYYSSAQGRFLSPDEFVGGPVDAFSSNDPLPPGPLPYADITNPQSLNKYAYTYNNPLRYTDPDGHDEWDVVSGLVGGAWNFTKNLAKGIAIASIPGYGPMVAGQATAESLTVAAGDYSSRGVSGVANAVLDQGEKGAVEIVTESVLTGGAAVAPFAKTGPVPTTSPSAPQTSPVSSPSNSTSFVVTPAGEAITIPRGATGPTPTTAPGVKYTGGSGGGPGLDPKVTGVRIMDANANQGPRVLYMNKSGQTVNPSTGRTVPKVDPKGHIPLKPNP